MLHGVLLFHRPLIASPPQRSVGIGGLPVKRFCGVCPGLQEVVDLRGHRRRHQPGQRPFNLRRVQAEGNGSLVAISHEQAAGPSLGPLGRWLDGREWWEGCHGSPLAFGTLSRRQPDFSSREASALGALVNEWAKVLTLCADREALLCHLRVCKERLTNHGHRGVMKQGCHERMSL